MGVYPAPSVNLAWTVNSTAYASRKVELAVSVLNDKLFDASVVATVDEDDIVSHDMMTCEVTMAGTDFNMRVEETILEIIDSPTEKVKIPKMALILLILKPLITLLY